MLETMVTTRIRASGALPDRPSRVGPGSLARAARWRVRKLASAEQAQALAEQTRSSLAIAYIEHDVEWAALKRDVPGEELLVLCDEEGDRLLGIAPFQVYPSHLEYGLGPIRFLRKRVRSYHLEEEPVTARPDKVDAITKCYETLSRLIPRGATVYCECVPVDSALHGLLENRASPLHRFFYVLPWGPPSPRYKITWEGSFERYLASIGYTSRKDLRRTLKKFEQRTDIRFELRRYQSEDEVDPFLKDAIPVSDKTYQKQKLGIGLSDDDRLQLKLKEAARRGYFLGHILYAEGQAVAFHYGFSYQSTFFMIDGGYDPEWSKSQMGVVIFCQVLKDIENLGCHVKVMDYMNGRNALKERTSNLATTERNYYLFRRTFAGSTFYHSLKLTNRLSDSLVRVLKHLNLADRTKGLIREWTGRGHI